MQWEHLHPSETNSPLQCAPSVRINVLPHPTQWWNQGAMVAIWELQCNQQPNSTGSEQRTVPYHGHLGDPDCLMGVHNLFSQFMTQKWLSLICQSWSSTWQTNWLGHCNCPKVSKRPWKFCLRQRWFSPFCRLVFQNCCWGGIAAATQWTPSAFNLTEPKQTRPRIIGQSQWIKGPIEFGIFASGSGFGDKASPKEMTVIFSCKLSWNSLSFM